MHVQAAQALEPAALIALLLLKPSGKVALLCIRCCWWPVADHDMLMDANRY